jgi:hypothetical protein
MDVATIVTSMASLIRKPRSKFWFACFRDANGRQRRKSTKTSDRKKAIKIAERRRVVGVVWNWAGGARQRPAPG